MIITRTYCEISTWDWRFKRSEKLNVRFRIVRCFFMQLLFECLYYRLESRMLIGLDFDDGNTEADTSIDTDGSWIGRDYRRVSRVMLFPCFSSASLKSVLWSGLSHYQATVWCWWEKDGQRWMDHLRLLRRLICISISSVHHALLTIVIASDVCYILLVNNCSSSYASID